MIHIRTPYYRLIPEIFNSPRRSFTQARQLDDLQQLYELLKHESQSTELLFIIILIFIFELASTHFFSKKMNPNGIFPNNELDLQKIKVYGFDFGLRSYFSKHKKK
jgi:hypothetical protein